MSKSANYYKGVNRILLKAIPGNLSRVLEFGCAEGNLGRIYKDENPDSTWYGLDIHKPSIDIAREKLDYARHCDVNQPLYLQALWQQKFDCLVYADVIEHLIDPEKTLVNHLQLLKPGGLMITCIPNIQHWSAIYELLSGDWHYRDSGLMDNTHLRFFTRHSFSRLMQKCELEIEAVKPLKPKVGAALVQGWDHYEAMMHDIEKMSGKYHNYTDKESFLAYQYVFVCRKLV